jgi:hypothetical protein
MIKTTKILTIISVFIGFFCTVSLAYTIDSARIQYRTHENPERSHYRYFIGISKNGTAIQENDIRNITIKQVGGDEMVLAGRNFWPGKYSIYNCLSAECTISGPLTEHGFHAAFLSEPPAGLYQIEVVTADYTLVTAQVDYPGKFQLPPVSSSSLVSSFKDNRLTLKWTNPVKRNNWDKVDRLQVVLVDSTGLDALFILVHPSVETVSIPMHVLDSARAVRDMELKKWYIQTRAYDADGNSYARGYTDHRDLVSMENRDPDNDDDDDDKGTSIGCFIRSLGESQ